MRKGWKIKKIGDACEKTQNINWQENENSVFKYIDLSSVSRDTLQVTETTDITATNAPSRAKKIVRKDDVIFATTRPTLKRVTIIEEELDNQICSTGFVVLRSKKIEILPQFIYYFIQTEIFMDRMELLQRGTSYPAVTDNDVKKTLILLPPLEEQKQIVAILEKAFAAIDRAKANVEKNLENAKELFQSNLNAIFSQQGEGWEEKKLGDITTKIGSGATPKGGQESYKESGISLIRSLNVYDEGFIPEKLAFIDSKQAQKLNNVTLETGDVLLNITGASVARCCVVPKEYLPARVNQHVSIIRIKEGLVNSEFLHYSLISKNNKDKLLGIGEQGSTRQAITKAQIESFYIAFPTQIQEQEIIVQKLNKVKEMCLSLTKSYKQRLDNLEELKKSILQKAFAGELTLSASCDDPAGFSGLENEQDLEMDVMSEIVVEDKTEVGVEVEGNGSSENVLKGGKKFGVGVQGAFDFVGKKEKE